MESEPVGAIEHSTRQFMTLTGFCFYFCLLARYGRISNLLSRMTWSCSTLKTWYIKGAAEKYVFVCKCHQKGGSKQRKNESLSHANMRLYEQWQKYCLSRKKNPLNLIKFLSIERRRWNEKCIKMWCCTDPPERHENLRNEGKKEFRKNVIRLSSSTSLIFSFDLWFYSSFLHLIFIKKPSGGKCEGEVESGNKLAEYHKDWFNKLHKNLI